MIGGGEGGGGGGCGGGGGGIGPRREFQTASKLKFLSFFIK